MPLNLEGLTPLTIRPLAGLTDDDLMRFSAENRAFRIERNAQGEITVMSPVGGIGSNFEQYLSGAPRPSHPLY